MLKNTIVFLDDVAMNTSGGILIYQNIAGQSDGVSVSPNLRQRSKSPAALESVTYNPRNQGFEVYRDAANTMNLDEFNYHVQHLFLPDGNERIIQVQIDPGEGETPVPTLVWNTVLITSFQRDEPNKWSGTFQYRDPVWKYVEESSEDTTTVVVEGNLPVRPKLKIIAGQEITRQRFFVLDNTGHSIRAYPVRIVPSALLDEENYRVFVNNVEVPFSYDEAALYFRVSAPVQPKNTKIDIYHGTSITNTLYAGKMNAAGMTLNSGIVTGDIEVSTEDSSANPIAPSLAWHPSISVRHPSRRDYTFGMEDDVIKLISNDTAEDLTALENDVDSFVLVSGTEIDSISDLNLTVHAGYQPGINGDANESSSNRQMMRVMMRVLKPGSAYHAAWTLGISDLDRSYSYERVIDNDTYTINETIWTTWGEIGEFDSLLSSLSQVNVTKGATYPNGGGIWYLDFPFKYPKVPFMSMSVAPRDVVKTRTTKDVEPNVSEGAMFIPPARGVGSREARYRGKVDYEYHNLGQVPVVIFDCDWVDPDTKQPFSEDADQSNLQEDPIRGRTRAVIKYRKRNDARWITAWSRTVTGTYPNGRSTSYIGITANTPGAVEIAIGLEPVGTRNTIVDWGTLEVDSVPIIHMDTSRMPDIVPTDPVDALHINGTLLNTANNKWFRFIDYLADAAGVEIDISADHPVIRGINGVGVVNGVIQSNGRDIPFLLQPGSNVYTTTDDLDTATLIETDWQERLIF